MLSFARSVQRLWPGILAFWTVIFFVGLFEGTKFLHSTESNFDPPPGSKAAMANSAMAQYFPNVTSTDNVYVVIETSTPTIAQPVLDPIAFSTKNCT